MKQLLYMMLLPFSLLAYSYQDTYLQVYAKVLPKVLVMNLPKTPSPGQLNICVLYEAGDGHSAERLIRFIGNLYGEGLGKQKVSAVAVELSALHQCASTSALMLMQSDASRISPVIQFAAAHHLFTAAYDPRHVEHGIIFALEFGSKVQPYINVDAAKQTDVPLDGALLQISKIYRKPEKPQ